MNPTATIPEMRPVRLLAAGGTIAMQGEQAVPALDAKQLIEQLPQMRGRSIEAETMFALPSTRMTLDEALGLARRACAAGDGGEGVVITTGTDTMEEVAAVCALLYGGEAPIVLTGANRPASHPGADGPANLLDAVLLAASAAAEGLGVVIAFGGEIHPAMTARKVDSTGPTAFGSPHTGPVGRIVEGRVWLSARPIRTPPLAVEQIEHRVSVVSVGLGDDGELLKHAAQTSDGLVVVALGAGHLMPTALHELRKACERIPALITCRPDRSSMLFATYGFEGSEQDLRSSGAVCVPFLSAAVARIALLCCLGAGLGRDGIAAALSAWDAH